MSDPDAAAVNAPCSCKLGRNVARYDLGDLHDDLRERHVEGASLRDLEGVVNRAILQSTLQSANAAVIGDVGAIYEALRGDDVTAGRRTEVRERLTQAGVDAPALREDFVSYQTVRTHLKECLDVDTTRETQLSPDDARGTIEWARSRSEGIVERTLQRLERADELAAGDLDVSHVVRVACCDCGASRPVDEFVDRGGCDCDATSSEE